MLGGAIADLMEPYPLVHLLDEALAGSAVGRVEGSIVTIGTSAASHSAVPVRACESGIQNYLLKTLAILPPEISDEGIVPFPIRESILMKIQ